MKGPEIARWVSKARAAANMTGDQLASAISKRTGAQIGRDVISKIKNQTRDVTAGELLAIEAITGYPIPGRKIDAVQVPLVSWVSASRLADVVSITERDIESYVEVAGLPAGDWIALTVQGDSMDRIAPPKSVILTNRRDKTLRNDLFYVFATPDGAATFKRFRSNPDRMLPYSFNPDHEPIIPRGEIEVVGRVRRVITSL